MQVDEIQIALPQGLILQNINIYVNICQSSHFNSKGYKIVGIQELGKKCQREKKVRSWARIETALADTGEDGTSSNNKGIGGQNRFKLRKLLSSSMGMRKKSNGNKRKKGIGAQNMILLQQRETRNLSILSWWE